MSGNFTLVQNVRVMSGMSGISDLRLEWQPCNKREWSGWNIKKS